MGLFPLVPAAAQPDTMETPLFSVSEWPIDTLSTADTLDYLGDLEKEVILHINMARTDPARYSEEFIRPRLQFFTDGGYREPDKPPLLTIEGIDAVEECAEDMEAAQSMSSLLPSRGLTNAAGDHARDLSRSGNTGHTGSDGSSFAIRIERHGSWENTIGEVISYGPSTGREIVAGLLIDDGVEDRSHRANLLNPGFHLVGISVLPHEVYGNVCVIEFAGTFFE